MMMMMTMRLFDGVDGIDEVDVAICDVAAIVVVMLCSSPSSAWSSPPLLIPCLLWLGGWSHPSCSFGDCSCHGGGW
eukprot:15480414-Alexandrium_andersonii.AAC.1